jgi:hypothetical protein
MQGRVAPKMATIQRFADTYSSSKGAPQLVCTAGATPERPSIEWRRVELRREALSGGEVGGLE